MVFHTARITLARVVFVLRASGETPAGGAHCCFYHLQPKHKPSRRHHHCTKKCVVTVVSVLYECLWSDFLVMKVGGQCIKDKSLYFPLDIVSAL